MLWEVTEVPQRNSLHSADVRRNHLSVNVKWQKARVEEKKASHQVALYVDRELFVIGDSFNKTQWRGFALRTFSYCYLVVNSMSVKKSDVQRRLTAVLLKNMLRSLECRKFGRRKRLKYLVN
ncbi:hypothetical protein TNCV_3342121 [Trichonephila clavipes]|nr:hypothetical protein TNCV_3342121 [Trichonephila clavipes]